MTRAEETQKFIDRNYPQFSGIVTGGIDFVPVRKVPEEGMI